MILAERKASNKFFLKMFLFCLQQAGSQSAPTNFYVFVLSFLPLTFVKVAVQFPDTQSVALFGLSFELEDRLISL